MAPGPPSPPSSNIKSPSQSPSHRASRSSTANTYLSRLHLLSSTTPTSKTPEAMAPKRAPVPRRQESKSIFSTAYTAVTDPENRSVVTGVAMFAAGVAFLHSSWSEFLLPA
ncbi:hypothetical protein DBV05_g1223 [Lasiodiplodia theobromae]|uniref:TOM core complex subunit Tom6 n=2 Tax=Lasiodiplodia TaxID=66739 RepID=A0A5N5DQX6_9PEZI|nr:hypothetical protein DBV05_g1223 [Lasiodiplodia theobromae]